MNILTTRETRKLQTAINAHRSYNDLSKAYVRVEDDGVYICPEGSFVSKPVATDREGAVALLKRWDISI
jgi:hypothetical protein